MIRPGLYLLKRIISRAISDSDANGWFRFIKLYVLWKEFKWSQMRLGWFEQQVSELIIKRIARK